MLLEERWRLIQAGTDRGDIKMRNNKLFVHGKLYAKIINNTLEVSETNEETSLSSAEDNPSITIHSDDSATTELSSPDGAEGVCGSLASPTLCSSPRSVCQTQDLGQVHARQTITPKPKGNIIL